VLVTPDTTEDDVVLLPSLEGIDGRDLDLLVEFLLERSVELHVVDDVRPLTLVGSDDSDLVGKDSGLEELGDDLLDVRSFGSKERRETGTRSEPELSQSKRWKEREYEPVEEGGSTRRDLLRSEVLVEHHRRICDGPGEVDVLPQPLGRGDSVLERSFVEHVGGELGETGMHSVLDLKSNGTVSEDDESFEEGLGETGSSSLLVHDDGTELL